MAENRLSQPVPLRDVQSVAVEMNEDERGLYDDIRGLVRECYQGRANVNRQALGFVMTHFRLRLGSSLYAFQMSLEDLEERVQAEHSDEIQWDDLPVSDEDNYSDSDPETAIPRAELTSKGQGMLTDLLDRCRAQASLDSKFTSLLAEIAQLRSKGYGKVMVFSQFRDTQVWLRAQLAKENGDFLLAGLSGSEDWIYQPSDQAFDPRAREAVVRQFRERPEGILLCTETAAESLNFQFCSAIINYDIPWNPMRLEQRIGRIDRIGQEKPVIRIVHLFYQDTVGYDAYTAMEERINEFQENVGTLQPILAANLESIIRESVMDDTPLGSAGEAVRSLTPSIGFDLDDLAAATADQQDPAPLLLGGLATALAVAALVISVIALVSPPDALDELGDYEFHMSDRGEFTVDLVRQALRRYDEEGREATVSYYNSPESAVGEWYVFIFDENDQGIAHPNQNLLGQDLKGDLAGYRFGEVMVGAGEQGLWVDYLFLNPATGNQEFKHSWVVRHDGLLFGSGWYQVLPSSPLDVT